MSTTRRNENSHPTKVYVRRHPKHARDLISHFIAFQFRLFHRKLPFQFCCTAARDFVLLLSNLSENYAILIENISSDPISLSSVFNVNEKKRDKRNIASNLLFQSKKISKITAPQSINLNKKRFQNINSLKVSRSLFT